jgi:hypothetical protein
MSEHMQNTTPEQDQPGQAPWLEQARGQARTAAEIRSQAVEPFDWEGVEKKQAGGWLQGLLFGPAAPGRLRLSWALPALALVVLGGATGTLAYVHLRSDGPAARDSIMLDQATHPAGPGKVRTQPMKLEQYLKAPEPKPQKKPAEARRPARKRPMSKKAKRRPVMVSKTATKAPDKPAARKPAKNGDIIFGHTDMPGGGEVIIVRPPSKLGPLFRTKDFKKGGPYGSRK